MRKVYVLHHIHNVDLETEQAKIIGIYSSEELAIAARDRLKDKPGFKENLTGFSIDEYLIDKDHWTEGFTTETW